MKSSTVIVDANIALSLVLDYPHSQVFQDLWIGWVQNDIQIAAPQLWLYEVTSAIHKIFMLGQIGKTSAVSALEVVLSLDVHLVDLDAELCESAFNWATRLNQMATYASFYLALAENLDAEFWTVDQHLSNTARQLGVEWVHLVKK